VVHIVAFDLVAPPEFNYKHFNDPGNGAKDHEAIEDVEHQNIVLGLVAYDTNNGANEEHRIALGEHEQAIASSEPAEEDNMKYANMKHHRTNLSLDK